MTPELEAEVRGVFGNQASSAVEVLNGYDGVGEDQGRERVQRAIFTLAQGDLARLRHFAERAQEDFRDVLFWAENPPDADEPRTYRELRERLGLPPDPEHEEG